MADTDDISPAEGPVTQSDAALDALSRSEDATAYIQQRQDYLRQEAGLEPETPADERQNRIDQALPRPRQDTAQARQTNGNGLDLDAQYRDAQAEYQAQQQAEQQAAQQQALAQTYFEARGRCMAKAESLRQTNPQIHAKITENLTTLGDVLDDQQGAALEHALVMHPEAVWLLGMRLSDERHHHGGQDGHRPERNPAADLPSRCPGGRKPATREIRDPHHAGSCSARSAHHAGATADQRAAGWGQRPEGHAPVSRQERHK
jgi:hypothetical protein